MDAPSPKDAVRQAKKRWNEQLFFDELQRRQGGAMPEPRRGELVDGCRQHGVWYQGNTYLFADEASLQRFETVADYYAQKSQSVMRGGGRR